MRVYEKVDYSTSTSTLRACIQIARPDHWFKNIFMLLGAALAFGLHTDLLIADWVPKLSLGIIATCIIASSNYTINEIFDANTDAIHPAKKYRPLASGQLSRAVAFIQWIVLTFLGFSVASFVSSTFLFLTFLFWTAAVVYNIPPIRAKDFVYFDVICESLNNPIRLYLGWSAVIPASIFPSLELVFAYWAFGAFMMSAKRLAEFTALNNTQLASQYRQSFQLYTRRSLLACMRIYAMLCLVCSFMFSFQGQLRLILWLPILFGFFVLYERITLQSNSPAQRPERLYRETALVRYSFLMCISLTGVLI